MANILIVTKNDLVVLPGSTRAELAHAEVVRPVLADELATVTLILRRRAELPPDVIAGRYTLTRDQLARWHGAHPDDAVQVHDTLSRAGLHIQQTDIGSRRVIASGSIAAMARLFGAALTLVRGRDPATGSTTEQRVRSGELFIPRALSGIVTAVLGLDTRPQASPRSRILRADAQPADMIAYLPTDVGSAYAFPPDLDGRGQQLAIVELGGGFDQDTLDRYFAAIGVCAPSVVAVGVDGARNAPSGDPNSADGEVQLDIEVAGALAPGAAQVVYFAPNTDQGFINAVSMAVHASSPPTVVSISWGAPEDEWTDQARQAFDTVLVDAAALGVTVCAAAGDHGSSDGVGDGRPHVDFPASSPHALGCGGTTLDIDSGRIVISETVWNDQSGGGVTGGGVSDWFSLPAYQDSVGVPARTGAGVGRGVPDVAGGADPRAGYVTLVNGEWVVMGGTGAVAALWAALLCRLAQACGSPFGLIQTRLYAGAAVGQTSPGFRDITTGNNGTYQAMPGWDACTGLGVPNGAALLKTLQSA